MKMVSSLFIFLVLSVLMCSGASATILDSDDFNRADNTSLESNWYETFGENAIENQTLHITDNAYNGVIWSNQSFSGERKISFKYIDFDNSSDAGWRVRLNNSASNSFSGEYIRVRDSGSSIQYYDGSSLSSPSGGSGEQAIEYGQTVNVSINSTHTWMWVDSTYIGSWNKAPSDAGYIGYYTDIAGSEWGIDDFEVSDTLDSMGQTGDSRYFWVSPTGDDSNNGTEDYPFGTLAYACTQTTDSTIINMTAGTWYNNSSAYITQDNITIIGHGSELDGEDFKYWGIYCEGHDNLTITGLEIHGYLDSLYIEDSNDCVIDNNDLWVDYGSGIGAALFIKGGDGNKITNNSIHDSHNTNNCINVVGSTYDKITSLEFAYNNIYNVTVHNAFNVLNGDTTYSDDVSGLYIHDNKFEDIIGDWPMVTNAASIYDSNVSNNLVINCSKGISLTAVNTTFKNNTVTNVTMYELGSHQAPSAGRFYNTSFIDNYANITLYGGGDDTYIINNLESITMSYNDNASTYIQNWTGTQVYYTKNGADTSFNNTRLFSIEYISGSSNTGYSDVTVDSTGICYAYIYLDDSTVTEYDLFSVDYGLVPTTSATINNLSDSGVTINVTSAENVTFTEFATGNTTVVELASGETYVEFSELDFTSGETDVYFYGNTSLDYINYPKTFTWNSVTGVFDIFFQLDGTQTTVPETITGVEVRP